MLFNSTHFFAFLPLALLGYWTVPERYKNVYLTFASWYFYSFWSVKFVGLILLSTVVDYFLALRIQTATSPATRRWLLIGSISLNLGLLGFFKYFNFFRDNMQELLHAIGVPWMAPTLHVLLPVGISFYTFQELSYTIDVYRGLFHARHRFFDFAAFVAFFPHMVAGPIQRSDTLLRQLEAPRRGSLDQWLAGGQLILWGLFKKVVIADNVAPIADHVFGAQPRPPLDTTLALLGAYAFAIQIYCDFSGYTDMARGVAKLFGIELMRNFDLPYLADSLRDFWRRWHISLSTWLRDYVYIPLGGGRGSRTRVSFNLLVTMLLGGLWHGASWMFVLWGAYHGALLIVERLLEPDERVRLGSPLTRVVRVFVTFHLVCFSWVLFRSPDLPTLRHWMAMLGSGSTLQSGTLGVTLLLYFAPLAFLWTLQARAGYSDTLGFPLPRYQRLVLVVLLYFGLTVLGADAGREFIYFQF
jgi:alginate O-acetyltransferase complex protein AlgI